MKEIRSYLIRYVANRVYDLGLSICKSKAETVKRTLLQTDNFFQSSVKKAMCLTRTQIKIFGISEKQIIKLDILVSFLKKRHFLHFRATIIFRFIFQFWKSVTLLSRTLHQFFQVALCKQQTVVLHHWKRYRTGTMLPIAHPSMNYWFQYCDSH